MRTVFSGCLALYCGKYALRRVRGLCIHNKGRHILFLPVWIPADASSLVFFLEGCDIGGWKHEDASGENSVFDWVCLTTVDAVRERCWSWSNQSAIPWGEVLTVWSERKNKNGCAHRFVWIIELVLFLCTAVDGRMESMRLCKVRGGPEELADRAEGKKGRNKLWRRVSKYHEGGGKALEQQPSIHDITLFSFLFFSSCSCFTSWFSLSCCCRCLLETQSKHRCSSSSLPARASPISR